MALMKCPDCDGKLSSTAPACCHCGRPNVAASTNVETPAPAPALRRPGHKRWHFVFATFAILTGIGVVGANAPRSNSTVPDAWVSPSLEPAVSKRAVYATKVANVRSGPSTSHGIVRKTRPSQRLPYVEKSGAWFKLGTSKAESEEWIHESVVVTGAKKKHMESFQLKEGGWRWHEEYGYAVAEGQITNTSRESLENVTAVVTFKTKGGGFITSSDALVDFNPLLPGQTSPWKVMATWNPAMGTASVQFKKLFGGKLTTYRE